MKFRENLSFCDCLLDLALLCYFADDASGDRRPHIAQGVPPKFWILLESFYHERPQRLNPDNRRIARLYRLRLLLGGLTRPRVYLRHELRYRRSDLRRVTVKHGRIPRRYCGRMVDA